MLARLGDACGVAQRTYPVFDFYNTRRRHSVLDRRTPDAVDFEQVTRERAA